MKPHSHRPGSVSFIILLAAVAAFLVPGGTAQAQEFPPAPLEVLESEAFHFMTSDGDEVSKDIAVPAGTEMILVAVSTGSPLGAQVSFLEVGGASYLIAETDGMAALDMRTVVYYRRLPAPSSGASGEVSIGFSSSYQDPFAAVLTTACVRGADMTDFPGTAAPFEGDWGEASGTATGAVEYAYYDASKRGDLVLNFIGATTGVGAADQPRMEELSRASGTGMTGAAAVTRMGEAATQESFGWAGVTGEYSMFMVPLRSRCFGTVQVNITPESAAAAGARWRVPGGEWLESGALLAGQPAGVWPFELRDAAGYVTPDPVIDTAADDLTVVEARYRREGAPEALKTDVFQGVLTETGGYEFSYSGSVLSG